MSHVDKVIFKALNLFMKNNVFEDITRHYFVVRLLHQGTKYSIVERLRKALNVLMLVANAKCVITTRLHVALPSLAFGKPTIFIVHNDKDPRLSGYTEYVKFFKADELLHLLAGKRLDDICNECIEYQSNNYDDLLRLKIKLIRTVESFLKNNNDD